MRTEQDDRVRRLRDIEDLLALAERVQAGAQASTIGPGLQVNPGERVIAHLDAELFEVPELSGTKTTQAEFGLAGFRVARTRERATLARQSAALVDSGALTLTDQRVVFEGQAQARQWTHENLTSYRPSPSEGRVTFYLADRTTPITLGYRSTDYWTFESRLALALALHRGDEQFLDELRAERDLLVAQDGAKEEPAEHVHARPRPLVSVSSTASVSTPLIGTSSAVAGLWTRLSTAASGLDVPRIMTMLRATWWRRATARFIDLCIAVAPAGVLDNMLQGPTPSGEPSSMSSAGMVVFIGTVVLLDTVMIGSLGWTPGKRMMSVTAVDAESGEPPTLVQAAKRAIVVAGLGVTIFGAGVVLLRLFIQPNWVGPHDRWGRTVVTQRSKSRKAVAA